MKNNTKLGQYIKPYRTQIILAIILLFTQANLELALPDYLSDIVNVGIQQGGFERPTPGVITESEMDRLLLFMDDENATFILSNYEAVTPDGEEYKTLQQDFVNLSSENVYVLVDEIGSDELDRMDAAMSGPLITVWLFEQISRNKSFLASMKTNTNITLGFDPGAIPPGMDLFDFFSMLPAEQRINMSNTIEEQFYTAMGEMMVKQMAIRATQSFYENMGADMQGIQTRYILRVGGIMLLMTILSMLSVITVAYFASKFSAGVARDIRRDLFEKVERFSLNEFDHFNTSSLITRATNDITQIQTVAFIVVRMVFYAPIMGIGGIIRALNKASSMWWLIGLAVAALIGVISVIFWVSMPKFKRMQKLIDGLNRTAREHLTGLMVVRAFNRESFMEERFEDVNKRLTKTTLFINRIMATLFPVLMFIMNIMVVGILWVGTHKVGEGSVPIGDVMAFMQYSMMIVFSFMMMSMLFIFLPRATVSINRVHEVLSTEPTIIDPAESKQAKAEKPGIKGRVEFKKVGFKYPGSEENVLSDINFEADPGMIVGIIGPTGSGKTSLINLIPRFYDVTEGAVMLDGIDVRDMKQHELRENISYVPQHAGLFSGTIRDNLLYANPNATEEDMVRAIKIAQAADFVLSRPDGLDSVIGQGGLDLSGGQKQRLSIARALVKDAPIYIFDDSFSALDFKTDAKLRRELNKYMKDKTMFIISQRIATIMNADLILVLQDGKLVGKGTHSELMESCGVYRNIAQSQHTEEGS